VGCRGGAVRRRTHGWQVHHQLVHIVSEPAVLSIGTDWLMCLFSRSLPRETVGRSARKAPAALQRWAGLSACARRTHCRLLFGAGRCVVTGACCIGRAFVWHAPACLWCCQGVSRWWSDRWDCIYHDMRARRFSACGTRSSSRGPRRCCAWLSPCQSRFLAPHRHHHHARASAQCSLLKGCLTAQIRCGSAVARAAPAMAAERRPNALRT
jgi:hypothetical protein